MAYDSTGIRHEQPRYDQAYAQAESDVRVMYDMMLEALHKGQHESEAV